MKSSSFGGAARLRASVFAVAVAAAFAAQADSTSVSIGDAGVTAATATTLNFGLDRIGDLGYDVVIPYATVDDSAIAGVDYTATKGSVTIARGTSFAHIDVPVAEHSGADKAFFLNLGSAIGIGAPPVAFGVGVATGGNQPYSVATADFDGDGFADVVAADSSSGSVIVARNSYYGLFNSPKSFASGTLPLSVAVADVNGDRRPDIFVANAGSNTFSVLRNNAAPGDPTFSFAAQQTFATGAQPRSLALADFNGDGRPDVVTANFSDHNVSAFLNTTPANVGNQAASFAPAVTFAAGFTPLFVATADINHDGRPDLVLVNSFGGGEVLLNTTDAGATSLSFAAQQSFATGSSPLWVSSADINGDGMPDLLVANSGDDTVSVLLNASAPGATSLSFAAQQTFPTGHRPTAVLAVNTNRDGKPDLAVACADSAVISVLTNTTAPGATKASFALSPGINERVSSYALALGDTDADGLDEIFVADYTGANSYDIETFKPYFRTFNSAPNDIVIYPPAPSVAPKADFAAGSGTSKVVAIDVNLDGRTDLLSLNGSDDTASVLLNQTRPGAATPSFQVRSNLPTGHHPFDLAVADFDGDGRPDLAISEIDDQTISLAYDDTPPGAVNPSFTPRSVVASGNRIGALVSADFNGDGRPDLAGVDFVADKAVVLLNGFAAGLRNQTFPAAQTFYAGPTPFKLKAADINGDGRPDLVIVNVQYKWVSVLLNSTAAGAAVASFDAARSFSVGNQPYDVVVADLNGDGRPDLAVVNNTDSSVSVLTNTTPVGGATTSFAPQQVFLLDGNANAYSVAVTDFDGDGLPDLLVSEGNTYKVAVLLNRTAPNYNSDRSLKFAPPLTFGTGNLPVDAIAADLNNDGRPDLIAANGASNTLSVLLNTQYRANLSNTFAVGTIRGGGTDSKPDAFRFTPVTNAEPGALTMSNTITVTGINTAAAIVITGDGATYSINGGAYTSDKGMVQSGDQVTLRVPASATPRGRAVTALNIGAVRASFIVTTRAADVTPDAFSFTTVTGAVASTPTPSNSITVSGLEPNYAGTQIAISGGQYSLNGGAFTSAKGTVKNGDSVTLQVTSSAISGRGVTARLLLGTARATFTVTTQ